MDAPKKIALFVPSFRGGGAERAMILFAGELAALGYDVDFLVAQDQGPLKNSLPPSVRVVDLAQPNVSRTIPALIRYLRRERPDALYSSVVNANISALFARALSGVRAPVIIREANVTNPKEALTLRRRIAGLAAPRIYRLADSIISVSEDICEQLCAVDPSLKNKISVLPNPVVSSDILRLGEASIEHRWFTQAGSDSSEPPVILGTGRLHPQKDFGTLISAFAEVRKHRDARLLILGEGPERAKLERLVHELGLQDDVLMPGYVENPFPYFKQARVFVLSSVYEGMPNVLLQAMAFGTPVVATTCAGGAKDVVTSAEFGRLVAAGDPRAMASAIMESLDLPRNELAARFVAERFSVQRATREYLQAAGL